MDPDWFLAFPRERPWILALVMVLYLLLSVYPQEVMYRPFILYASSARHRHEAIRFILISSVVYSFVHIVYSNGLAVAMAFAGGI